jgi:hypothetical protein
MILNLLWLCIAIGWMEDGMIVRLLSIHLRDPSDPCLSFSIHWSDKQAVYIQLWKAWRPSGPRIRIGNWELPARSSA